MTNQGDKRPENERQNQPIKSHDEQGITQNRPSHMNQGTEAFRPDQAKQQDERRDNQKTGQTQPPPSRKAS